MRRMLTACAILLLCGSSALATITIARPETCEVFSDGTIVISGTCTGSCSSLEACWAPVMGCVPLTSGGGSFSGTMPGMPMYQQGTTTVRATDLSQQSQVLYTTTTDCGIGTGQSNMTMQCTNPGVYTATSIFPVACALDYGTGLWKILADPIKPMQGSGSSWPQTASEIVQDLHIPFCFLQCAAGGTPIKTWRPASNGGVFPFLFDQCTSLVAFFNGTPRWTEMTDGEQDCADGVSQAQWQTDGAVFASSAMALWGVQSVILDEIGQSGNCAGLDAVRLAQQFLWDNDPNVDSGAITYDVPASPADGGVHWISAAACATVGHRRALAIEKGAYNSVGVDARGPQIVRAVVDRLRAYIDVTYNEPLIAASMTIVPEIRDNGVLIAVGTPPLLVAPDRMRITFNAVGSQAGPYTYSIARDGTGYQLVALTDLNGLPSDVAVNYPVFTTTPCPTVTPKSCGGQDGQVGCE